MAFVTDFFMGVEAYTYDEERRLLLLTLSGRRGEGSQSAFLVPYADLDNPLAEYQQVYRYGVVPALTVPKNYALRFSINYPMNYMQPVPEINDYPGQGVSKVEVMGMQDEAWSRVAFEAVVNNQLSHPSAHKRIREGGNVEIYVRYVGSKVAEKLVVTAENLAQVLEQTGAVHAGLRHPCVFVGFGTPPITSEMK